MGMTYITVSRNYITIPFFRVGVPQSAFPEHQIMVWLK